MGLGAKTRYTDYASAVRRPSDVTRQPGTTAAQTPTAPRGAGVEPAPTRIAARAAPQTRQADETAMYNRACELGLCGPLGDRRLDEWSEVGNGAERGIGAPMVDMLRERIHKRLMSGLDLGRVNTALTWFGDFLRDTTRVPFVPLSQAGDLVSGIYNAETLELFAEYMCLRGSRRKGEALTADYVQTTVSTIRILRSIEAHYGVLVPDTDVILGRGYKEMRKEGGPAGERKESRGFRAAHFRELVRKGTGRWSPAEWALALTAHNLLLRGGEIGTCTSKNFDPARDLTLTSIVPQVPCPDSGGRMWMIVWVVSIKDVAARNRAVPLPVMQRGESDDPLCTYSALMQHWLTECTTTPACNGVCRWCKPRAGDPRPGGAPPVKCARAHTPLFRTVAGSCYKTADVRALGKDMAEAAGISANAVGGKLWRIGGATDLRDVLGCEGGQCVIKERGRWGSDVAFVYQRALMRDALEASARIGDAARADMESMIAGWVQPAAFR